MNDPRIPVLAALLAQGRLLHWTCGVLALASWVLGPPWWLGLLVGLVFVIESWFAARVGLDARLFECVADGLELSQLDAGLLGLGLVGRVEERTLAQRIDGARRLWRTQLLLVIGQGALAVVSLVWAGVR